MTPEQWERVKTVFAAALDEPADRRAAFLEPACGGDAGLRDEVESLLAASTDPEPVIEAHALDLGAMLGVGEAPAVAGRQFGNYRIVREIGRGGMGAVFLADRADGAFRHQVAIKVIRQTLADPDLERRFRRERQILASLTHPNIARLLDGGMTPQGEPFLVMEYVDGEPLPAYASRVRLDLDSRLALFQQVVCGRRLRAPEAGRAPRHQAVEHPGHRRRAADAARLRAGEDARLDDGETRRRRRAGRGRPGDRRRVDTRATALRAFTPAYASPEQVRGGGITTSSDVYSPGRGALRVAGGRAPVPVRAPQRRGHGADARLDAPAPSERRRDPPPPRRLECGRNGRRRERPRRGCPPPVSKATSTTSS